VADACAVVQEPYGHGCDSAKISLQYALCFAPAPRAGTECSPARERVNFYKEVEKVDNSEGGTGQIGETNEFDAVVVGAGISGLCALWELRNLGLRVRVFEKAADVGGTWWWNCYPGAQIDSPGAPFYSYMFSEELAREWTWTKTLPNQREVLAYLRHVAKKFDLRRHIEFDTTVTAAVFDGSTSRWQVTTNSGRRYSSQFLITAVGTLSTAIKPTIPGVELFEGTVAYTGTWPQEGLDLTGKRVGVIGTGSSGVGTIPVIAEQAEKLFVFQRTPQYVVPARTADLPSSTLEFARANWTEYRQRIMDTGAPFHITSERAVDASPEERQARYEQAWKKGGLPFGSSYCDHLTNERSNGYISDFVRSKILEVIKDPETAKRMLPDYMFGTRRLVLGEGYYETFNRDNVTLVDLREDPILGIEQSGIRTASGLIELDVIVFAIGFDAFTGTLTQLNPTGPGGALKTKWADGPKSHLGVFVAGLPNLFMIQGPQGPGLRYHIAINAEQQVQWLSKLIKFMRDHGHSTIDVTEADELEWVNRVEALWQKTLFPRTDSFFNGGNVEGKSRRFIYMYLDGPGYHRLLSEIARNGYPGLLFS
jgi:cyclohexanone monooxygenase